MANDSDRALPVNGALQPGDLINDREAARLLGVPVQTLRNWRHEGKGPPYRKVGQRIVRYHRAELDSYTRGETAQ